MVTTVTTPAFEGPIALLLELVTAHEVDIFEVPLHDVVVAFVEEVASWEQVDLPAISEFVVVAAMLVELKSKRLLPGPDELEPDEELVGWEARDLLLARLLECRAYAAAGDAFAILAEQAARSVPRSAGFDDGFVPRGRDLLEGVTPAQIAAAYRKATQARPVPVVDLYHVTVESASVSEAVVEVEAKVAAAGRATFRELTGHLTSRMEIIVRFLAVLELHKQGRVALDQGTTFGALEVVWVDAPLGAPPVTVGVDDYEG